MRTLLGMPISLLDRSLFLARLGSERFGKRRDGFTLAEAIIVVVILGVLSSIALVGLDSFLRRERANAVALSLYGWLNEVRQAALRLQQADQACTIVFRSGARSLKAELASVDLTDATNAECISVLGLKSSLTLDRSLTGGLPISMAPSSSVLTYTPRTLTANSSDITVGLVVNGRSPLRCVKILAVSGFIQIGRNDQSSSASGVCSYSVVRGF